MVRRVERSHVYMAGDHLTVPLMQQVEHHLSIGDVSFTNLGTRNEEHDEALQLIIPAVVERVLGHAGSAGILACGTGAGVEIGANRFRGIRASLCVTPKQAEFARVYDDANVLCLSAWLTADAGPILDAWFDHAFDGDARRAQMFADFDRWGS